jgi:threonine dehydrogenase-like Zn-dependent dehydrogenase
MNKGLTIKNGADTRAAYFDRYSRKSKAARSILPLSSPTDVPWEDGPELYETFRDKKDGCIKVVLQP